MAHMKSDASLDEQIEKAQERLEKAKAHYDSASEFFVIPSHFS